MTDEHTELEHTKAPASEEDERAKAFERRQKIKQKYHDIAEHFGHVIDPDDQPRHRLKPTAPNT